jgi:phosphate starvation-inducible protein PhoH
MVHFTADDVMRHALVSRIVRAYEKDAAAHKRKPRDPE